MIFRLFIFKFSFYLLLTLALLIGIRLAVIGNVIDFVEFF